MWYELVKRLTFPILKVEQREPAPLPGHTQGDLIQILRPSPAYLRYKLLFWKLYAALWATAVLVACGVLLAVNWWLAFLCPVIIAIAVFKAALLYVATRLDYEMRWYVVTDRSLLIRQGVWVVREICLTFANAQNVRVKQGPLQRLFGFAAVEVDTAGGGRKKDEEAGSQAHHAVLHGLSDPGYVRDLVLDLLRRHRTAGLGDPDDHAGTFPPRSQKETLLLNEIWTESRQLRATLEAEPTA